MQTSSAEYVFDQATKQWTLDVTPSPSEEQEFSRHDSANMLMNFARNALQCSIEKARYPSNAASKAPPLEKSPTTDSVLFSNATEATPSQEDAMHPQRAWVGGVVLSAAKDVLKKSGGSVNSGSKLVSRLFFDSMPEAFVKIESIQQLIHPDILRRFLRTVAAENNCVEATFHGARAECIDGIIKEGMNTEACQMGAYGYGAYVGTHAGIAHQYATPDKTGLRHMCLMLVVVGSNVVLGKAGQRSPRSVTAMDSMRNPTQYCFVDDERLLASHVITYRVTADERKRTGGGWDDPFERNLNAAIRRSGRIARKSGQR